MTNIEAIASPTTDSAVAQARRVADRFARVREAVERVVLGQREAIEQALITLLAGGHGLLVGVPGLAKTRLVETRSEEHTSELQSRLPPLCRLLLQKKTPT